MGQYQQWLLAQHMSQNLKTEIETLETEQLYLQDRIAILEQSVPEGENVILQALQAYLHHAASEDMEMQAELGIDEGARSTSDRSLWSQLPGVETPTTDLSFSFADLPAQELVEDDQTFFEQRKEYAQHLTQGERAQVVKTTHEERLADKETRRLNENIQRWFDRWHRQVRGISRTEEVPDEQ